MKMISTSKALALALGLATASASLPTRTITQLPLGTRIENLAVRSNGDLLLSLLDPYAAVYYVSNPASDHPETFLLHNFTSVGGLLGITEVRPDVFVVVGSNFSGPSVQINGTGSAWTIDLSNESFPAPEVSLLTNMKEADFLNGATHLANEENIALIADSAKGLVWRLDATTGSYDVAVQVPEMAYPEGAMLEIGINGVQLHDGFMYWTNTFEATIYRVAIDSQGYQIENSVVEKVVNVTGQGSILDDFIFDDEGNIWAATNLDNTLLAIDPATGKSVVAAGSPDQLTLAGDTAAQWARSPCSGSSKTLYVSTSGGLSKPINGTLTEGGKVVAVDTTGFSFGN